MVVVLAIVVVLKRVVVVLDRVVLAIVVVQGLETLKLDGTVHLGYLRPRNCVAMKSHGAQSAGKNAVVECTVESENKLIRVQHERPSISGSVENMKPAIKLTSRMSYPNLSRVLVFLNKRDSMPDFVNDILN